MAAERLFADEASLVETLAGEIERRLNAAASHRGVGSLIATGGATPVPLYDALNRRSLPWDRLWVTLTDERWLPITSEGSNERLVRERLLGDHDRARFVALKTDDGHPRLAAPARDAALASFPRPTDVVLLGMGPDGHFASLFPDNPALGVGLDEQSDHRVIAVHAPGAHASPERLSLTLAAILDSRWIAVLIRGADKLALARAPGVLPIARVLGQRKVPVEVFWAP